MLMDSFNCTDCKKPREYELKGGINGGSGVIGSGIKSDVGSMVSLVK